MIRSSQMFLKTAVILAGELLKNAEELMEKVVHPTAISNGYRRAATESLRLLDKISRPVRRSETSTLKSIAITAMTGKSSEANADFLADFLVDFFDLRLATGATVIKPGGVSGRWNVQRRERYRMCRFYFRTPPPPPPSK